MNAFVTLETASTSSASEAWLVARGASDKAHLRTFEARRAALESLRSLFRANETRMAEALHADMGRSAAEAWTAELTTLDGEIGHALKHLGAWTKHARAGVPLKLWPARASIRYEPKGAVLVIGAWNLPFAVTLAPAVAAIAAGNSVVCKPSELAPQSARVMRELVERHCDPQVLQVVTGEVETTRALLSHRWDHVFFTGGGEVGKKVAVAAAEHGTPTTLELGGKCAAYVHKSADIAVAAKRIAWGKFMNAGQVCIAPDYAIVDRHVQPAFEDALTEAVEHFYGEDPAAAADYARIVNERHFDRIVAMMDASPGRTVLGGTHDRETRYIAPTVVSEPAPDSPLGTEEVFGPVLPLFGVDDEHEALARIATLPSPLAVYPFAKDKRVLALFEDKCRAGAVVSNDVVVNHAVRSLPFGGVGASGHGVYHGIHGFRTFSHAKAVLRRGTGSDPALRYPPYTASKLKWLRRLG